MPGLVVVDAPASFEVVWNDLRVPLLAPRLFLDTIDRCADDPLPPTWHVTTNSIAARVAVHLGARELALLKSTPLPPRTTRAFASRRGLVDPAFPAVARPLASVTYLNLRDPCGGSFPLPRA
jgi:5-(aminomethyl)-3-furanmethanol phosphate kinase